MLQPKELAAGVLYRDGEPEMRHRPDAKPVATDGPFMLVTSKLADENGFVGTLATLFAAQGLDVVAAERQVRDEIERRVAKTTGRTLSQDVRAIALPDDPFRFVVIHLLRDAQTQG